ncbi:hypothetical protein [Priestia sp. YIM B13489]|uniref:hypothetical protein n=1 Tax=Priestia sp. YIM B13489 TaxID=3366313 RepID=UPI00366E02E4
MNLLSMTTKTDILAELKQGNTAVLKGLPPVLAMQYGLQLQNEVGQVENSAIDEAAVGNAMLNLMGNTGIKEQIIKQMEDNKVTG